MLTKSVTTETGGLEMPEDYEFSFEAADDNEAIERAALILAALYGIFPTDD